MLATIAEPDGVLSCLAGVCLELRIVFSARFRIIQIMMVRISATELARKLGEVLGKVRYRRDVFVIERNGEPVARLLPWPAAPDATLGEAFRAWREAGHGEDPSFADDLERVNRADRAPRNPWA